MKKMLSLIFLSVGLLSACQEQSLDTSKMDTDEQGLVQTKIGVESENLNQVLSDLHNEGMEIIDIKLSEAQNVTGSYRTIYTVIYEKKS